METPTIYDTITDTNHSSIVIDHPSKSVSLEAVVGISYLYCDYRDEENQTPVNMVGALLNRAIKLLHSSNSLPSKITSALRVHLQKDGTLGWKKACALFSQILSRFRKVHICIDALGNETKRGTLLESLATISQACTTHCSIHLFLNGRPQVKWDDEFKYYLTLGSLTQICLEEDSIDIKKYIAHQIQMDTNKGCMNDDRRRGILEKVVCSSDEM